MTGCLQVQDLFAAGLGLELGGAYLLGRGLIASPRDQMLSSGSYYGSNPYLAVSRARDRTDAISGLIALACGFGLQILGYLLTLSGSAELRTGAGEAIVALALAAVGLATVIAFGRVFRQLRLRRTLVSMACYLGDGSRLEYPRASMLMSWATVLGDARKDGESDIAFLRRQFGVKDAAEISEEDQNFHRLSDGELVTRTAENQRRD